MKDTATRARFIRPVALAHRQQLVILAGWSLVEALPVLVSGWLVARAMDRGFLVGDVASGMLALVSYGLVLAAGAVATRRSMGLAAVLVEPCVTTLSAGLYTARCTVPWRRNAPPVVAPSPWSRGRPRLSGWCQRHC